MDLTPSSIRRKTFQLVRRGFDPQEVGAFLEQLSEHVSAQQQAASAAETSTARLESELKEARSAEEAVRLTMVAATQAKEEILATANAEATQTRQAARTESDQLRESARRDAEQTITSARQEALALLETSRLEAEERVSAARAEHASLMAQVEQLREMVGRTRHTLSRLVDGALEELDHADELLRARHATPAQPSHGEARRSEGRTFELVEETPPGVSIPKLPSRLDAEEARRPELEIVAHSGTEAREADTSVDIVAELEPLLGRDEVADSVVQLPDAVDRLLDQLRDIQT